MKNTRMIGKLILLILGACTVFLSVKALMDVPETGRAFEEAVWLENPAVLPENEGKTVIIHGPVEMTKPAYDEELGLTLDTVKAFRYAEEYAQTSSASSNYEYNWVARGSDGILGGAKMGGFELDPHILAGFPADDFYADFDAEEISAYETAYGEHGVSDRVYVLRDAEYYYDKLSYKASDSAFIRGREGDLARERVGAWAYSYRAFDASRHEVMTLAGVQQGDRLVVHETLGPVVQDGICSAEELLKAAQGYTVWTSAAFLVVGLVMIFFGLRMRGSAQKNQKNQKRKRG